MQLKADLLAAQLDEHRARLAAVDSRSAEFADRFEQVTLERDIALTRASELEGILVAAQQALGGLERRLVAAEQGMLERDDQIAALNAELDARTNNGQELTTETVDPAKVAELIARAERAEASLALHVADLAQLSEAQAARDSHARRAAPRSRARHRRDRQGARSTRAARSRAGLLPRGGTRERGGDGRRGSRLRIGAGHARCRPRRGRAPSPQAR